MSIRVVVHGAAGRMGRSVVRVLAEDPGYALVGAVDRAGSDVIGRDAGELAGVPSLGVVVTTDLAPLLGGADVVIDFSLPAGARGAMDACRAAKIALVTGTTGLDAETAASLDALAEVSPVVAAPNFSQGVTVLFHLAGLAAARMGEAFDAEIVEMHHRRKVDAPSGTAVRLAEVVADAKGLDRKSEVVHGRSGDVGARPARELAVLALRGGDVVGEHTLFLAGEGERLELTHRATDRMIFARGAVRAARWVVGKAAGRYDMPDVMGLR